VGGVGKESKAASKEHSRFAKNLGEEAKLRRKRTKLLLPMRVGGVAYMR
jgi:hypothetical protein